MTTLQMIRKLQKMIQKNPSFQAVEDLFELIRLLAQENKPKAHTFNRDVRTITVQQARNLAIPASENEKFYNLHKKSLLFDAQVDFDAYLQYVEFERDAEKRFYLPRRKIVKPIVECLQMIEDDQLDLLAISQPPGTGKLISNETPVWTTKGWKTHGDLRVGDQVYNHLGEAVAVTHVFPKDFANRRVTFSNGEQIDCHENHEWVLYDRNLQREVRVETRTLESQVLETGEPGKRKHRYRFQLPLRKPLEGVIAPLPVDPYVLGAWLGDGTTTKPAITEGVGDEIIVDTIVAKGYEISSVQIHPATGCPTTYFKKLSADLQTLRMCRSREKMPKRIPEIYLTASIEQRLELLAGLLDTDGTCVHTDRKYKFSTVFSDLRDDFMALISTLGWRVYYSTEQPRLSSGGVQGKRQVYIISFSPDIEIPCRVPRKQLKEFDKQRRVAIVSIEPIEPAEGNCISVEGGMYLVGKQMIPTHNSTLGIFFLSWQMGKYPHMPNLASAHSDKLTRSFYDGVLSIITDPEYLWADVFPLVQLVGTNAKDEAIDLEKPKRFKSLTCRSIDGSLTGATRCERILYADDLVSGIEEALNKDRLESLWNKYTNDLKSRKKLGCKEVHIATRWSVHDPIGKLEQQYGDDPRARFLALPALDENEESNFNYGNKVGFDTAYFLDMKANLDDVSWRCLFQNEPIEREGLLFPDDELSYYNGVLPEGDPVKYFVCDVAWGGGDALSSPFGYRYPDGSVYIPDVIYDKGDKDVTRPIVVGKLKHHMPVYNRFEANNGGDEYADTVDDLLRKQGVRLNITHRKAPANTAKLSRIIQAAPDIKRFYFLDKKHRTKEYQAFMKDLTGFMQTGKNKNDDAPDSLAMLAALMDPRSGKVEIIHRPF